MIQIAEGCQPLSMQASIATFAIVPTFRYFVSKNPLMRDDMDKEQKNPDVLLCVHRDFP
ncbi:hypothetical protein [Bacteroides acidifaciens]|uniref:hypothetical protein n=1 Tax=Bacteroides acidifaciens TaxID=85831 RepID=UPI00260FE9C5|nr:hypothetical protein [Bacteroides acidifaciens]